MSAETSSPDALKVVRSVADLRAVVAGWRRAGETVALIPTMGYLHEGHLALVRRGRELATRTVASLFVNPTQFGPTEDLDRYPRDEAGVVALGAAFEAVSGWNGRAPDISGFA